nr:UvrD-like helicase, ATP-binding domain, P-loop containing nucleoside triphosphate hydrolase [Tanacetum cinerariifolium]
MWKAEASLFLVYRYKVESIPLTFESEEHYFGSFVNPLLEETRSELASSMEIVHGAPYADMLSCNESRSVENRVYDVTVGPWKNQYRGRGRDDYETLLGDLLLFVDGKPESVSILKRVGRTWALAMVKSKEDNSTSIRVKASQPIEFQDGMFAVFLMNVTSQKRICNSLHVHRNLDIIKEVIYSDFKVKENCNICSFGFDNILSLKFDPQRLLNLNESQKTTVREALCKTQCCHTSSVEQIWGPHETGKTLTDSVLLSILLQMEQRILACASTNVAILQLASRMLSLVRESSKTTVASGDSFCSVGGLLLSGSKERLKVSTDIEEIYLEHRVKRIAECLGPVTGWKHCIRSMIELLENYVSEYYNFIENKFLKEKPLRNKNEDKRTMLAIKSFSEFVQERFNSLAPSLRSSYKLHVVNMEHLNILVIDEAAQLKEAESIIPLQLPGMKHAILIGDERQLPARINSNVYIQSGFGRSLFDRLSFSGHSKHLLNVQYRMNPSISSFPNLKFYQNQILDAQNVLSKSYGKRYISGPMFGSYSFIVIVGGKEEKDDDGRSRRNMVEVAIVIKIVKNLYRGVHIDYVISKCSVRIFVVNVYLIFSFTFTSWQDSQKKLTIGVMSPYAAQVASIQEKLAHKYEKLDGFSVKVKSIDGFQGGEEDIIILSTVRSNIHGSLGFISSPQRTNVALTRARHCLWILGNERTLTNCESIWKDLVSDARNLHCFFDADSDECLKMTIIGAKKELEQLDDLVKGNSVLFEHAKWKADDFKRSFGKLTRPRLKKQVEGIYVISTIDIIKEVKYTQVLKVWNVLPLEEIPGLTKRLESILSAYSDDYLNRACEDESEVSVNPSNARNYVENSKVTESLLLMKFYSLSCGVVSHLLSSDEVHLPMQVTDEQMDIILSPKSSFIIGRSGTGKTTILTMKLFQHELKFCIASDGISEAESSHIRDGEVEMILKLANRVFFASFL